MQRRLRTLWLMVAVSLVAALFLISPAESADSGPDPSVKAFAETAAKDAPLRRTPIKVGDVIAQGKRSGDTCTFADRFGVGTEVTGNAPDLLIGWAIDEQCRVRIDKIRPATAADAVPTAPNGVAPNGPGTAVKAIPAKPIDGAQP